MDKVIVTIEPHVPMIVQDALPKYDLVQIQDTTDVFKELIGEALM